MSTGELRLLIVDDDPDDVLLFRDCVLEGIRDIAIHVEDASTPAQALELLAGPHYDVIVIDYRLGPESGLDLLRTIRSRGIDRPVILLTGVGDEQVAVEAMKAGTTDYLVKSALTPSLIGSSIRHAVELSVREAEKRHAEAELRDAETRYRILFEQSPYGVLLMDLDTGMAVETNEVAYTQLGYTREEFAALRISDYEASETPVETAAHMQKITREGSDEFEALHRTKSGEIRNVHVWAKTLALGAPALFYAIFQDITERKQAESSQRLQSAALNAAANTIVITDTSGAIEWVNPAFTSLTGHAASEVLGQNPRLLKSGRHERSFYEQIWRTICGGSVWTGEIVNRRKDGSLYTAEEIITPVRNSRGEIAHFVAIQQDITDRKRAEEFQARLAAAIEATSDFVAIADVDGRPLYVNKGGREMVGIGADEDLSSVAIPDSHPKWARELVLNEGIPTALRDGIWRGETALLTRDGREVPVLQVIVAPKRPDGTVGFVATIMRDISERKRGEEALRLSEERLRDFVEHGVVGMYQTTPDGRILMANPALLRMLGYASLEEASEENLETMSGEGRYPQRPLFKATIERDGVVAGFESTWITRKGKTLHVRESARAVRDSTGKILYYEGTVEDLTATKQLEAQLRQAQKMEAVGRLAGGVAHDFNNLLQAMLSATQVLRAGSAEPIPATRLGELEDHIRRGAQLTRQLLLFARKEKPAPAPVDLNELLRESARLMRRLVRENITIDVQLADQPLVIFADPTQLGQVVMNLTVNSSDAMAGGGVLTIRAGNEGDGEVFFSVADTGHGIPDEIRARLFEPFFTTKEAGRGTGLGLSVVHGIVSAHGGRIDLESAPGRGTTFRIVLPRAASGTHLIVSDAVVAGELATGRGERVLLVEDEEAARAGLIEILTMLGYRVDAVGSAEEAGRLPAKPPFDLLLTDLMLPGASGSDLARGLRERWPGLKVILMSGYANDEAVRRGVAAGAVRFLQKPFDMETLARELRAALAE